ncbi:MAG: HNH endonuclease [Burkholderiaceae bacterium]|nr:HNH endonuclease [Burkholderiaceae bacterium]
MSKLGHTRLKIYRTVARQLHGLVPCWVCGGHVDPEDATLEHIQPLSEGGSSHMENLAITHAICNHQRHARAKNEGAQHPCCDTTITPTDVFR